LFGAVGVTDPDWVGGKRQMDKDPDTERIADELAAMAKIAAEADISRRTFVKGAAGAAATFALLIAPGSYSKPSLVVGGTTRLAGTAPHSVVPSHSGTQSKSKHDNSSDHDNSDDGDNGNNGNNGNNGKEKSKDD
jgi:hypothetical protein